MHRTSIVTFNITKWIKFWAIFFDDIAHFQFIFYLILRSPLPSKYVLCVARGYPTFFTMNTYCEYRPCCQYTMSDIIGTFQITQTFLLIVFLSLFIRIIIYTSTSKGEIFFKQKFIWVGDHKVYFSETDTSKNCCIVSNQKYFFTYFI